MQESDPNAAELYQDDSATQLELFQRRIDINLEEQLILKKRIFLMQECLSELSNFDPIFIALDKQILIDRIQLDELTRQEEDLVLRLKCIEP